MKILLQKKWLLATAVIMLLFGATLVYAFYFHTTTTKVNEFAAAEVSCAANETWDGSQKTSVSVTNTGTVSAYIRVRLVGYWLNSSGNIAAKSSVLPEFTLAEGWLYDAETDTYYYQYPVAAGESTPNLLAEDSAILLWEEDGYTLVVDILAEAIQAEPATAVEEAWSVGVGEDGTIEMN